MKKSDVNILKRGIKYLGWSLLTTACFALAVVCFICTAQLTGYAAVAMVFGGLICLLAAYIGLYALGFVGVNFTESKGERE